LFEELDLKIASTTSESLITPRQTLPVTTCSRALCSQTSPKYCC
jgi:hypothetical protein